MLDADSTIYALSTAPGRAAIAVVRISGPACVSVCIFLQATVLAPAFPAAYTDNGIRPLLLDIQVPMSQ